MNEQLRNSAQGQESSTKSPKLTEPTHQQLKAELERVQSLRNADRQAIDEMNELLGQEEGARQEETRQRILYRNRNEKLAMQLENYKVAMSTLQEEDETEELQHPSAHIADDPGTQEFVIEEEGDRNERDELVLGP